MTPVPIDVAALRRLLDAYQSWLVSSSACDGPRDDWRDALVANAPALLRAVEERDALLAEKGVFKFGIVSYPVPDKGEFPTSVEVWEFDTGRTMAFVPAIRRAKEPQ